MKKISNISELSLEVQASIVGAANTSSCSCSSRCTCVCDDKRDAPKASTARENHSWESKKVKSDKQLQNL